MTADVLPLFVWQRHFEAAALPAPAQHLGLVLAFKTDPDLAIPARFSPSIARIAEWSRQSAASVKRNLNVLEEAGWLVRVRPSIDAARKEHARTRYALTVPAGWPVDNLPVAVRSRGKKAAGLAHPEPCPGSHRAKGMAQGEPLPALSTSTSSSTFADAGASGPPDGVRARPLPVGNEAKTAATLEWLEAQLGGFMSIEESTARGMLDGGSNRAAVRNKLQKMRGAS